VGVFVLVKMASNTNPVDINYSGVMEVKTSPNIGDREASTIVKLREEKGALALEDLKTLPSIHCTIWDPLVSGV
jgi:DNA uptake protein ComE-like DNA-binding protein